MLIDRYIKLERNFFESTPPKLYYVGMVVYSLLGINQLGQSVYKLKKIPQRKLKMPPALNCCLLTDQGERLYSDQGLRLCPDQGCNSESF